MPFLYELSRFRDVTFDTSLNENMRNSVFLIIKIPIELKGSNKTLTRVKRLYKKYNKLHSY